MRVIFGEKDEGECLGEKRFEAALLALLRDALASPLRLKHLVCRLRITTNRQNEVRRCLPPGEYDAAATPHPLPLAEIVPSHRGFWLLGFSNLPLSLVPQAQMGGKESPSEADVKAVLASGTSPITS